jgi:quinoprotein glucose dehydrogenase
MPSFELSRLFRQGLAILGLVTCLSGLTADSGPKSDPLRTWEVYRGDPRGTQYSELTQINRGNVGQLVPAWSYRTGGAEDGTTIHSNPIVIDGGLYLTGPKLEAICLDAMTGEENWTFRPTTFSGAPPESIGRNRGVTYWRDGPVGRIFHFVKDRIYALDAATGQPISSFGGGGFIDLRERPGTEEAAVSFEVTTPGVVLEGLLIIGGHGVDGDRATSGCIRAFDARTGALRWTFDPRPQSGDLDHETWKGSDNQGYGGVIPRGGFTVDAERGWIFGATGSPRFDVNGANHPDLNLLANCVLALDARTGERIWHYQTVHHDLWNYGNPAAPILATITKDDVPRDVVVQLTKMGLIFVLDRETGEPIFPVDEIPVPAAHVPEAPAWPTQPVPQKPRPLSRWSITAADLFEGEPVRAARAQAEFRQYRNVPIFTPPSLIPSLMLPGTAGGMQWSGASFEAGRSTLFVTSHDIPSILHLVPARGDGPAHADPEAWGRVLYLQDCAACHGLDRAGIPPAYPTLIDVPLSDDEIIKLIVKGRGLMPGFADYSKRDQQAMLAYLFSDTPQSSSADTTADTPTPRYVRSDDRRFADDHGAPWIKPPYGKLSSVNLADGEIEWEVPLGEYPHLVEQGIRNTGTMNFGGAVATAGGVVFVAATADEKIRAFDQGDGQVLWEYQLPSGGYATPCIYEVNGRQYVVIACGGGGEIATPTGDTILAFALPNA